MSLQFDNPFEYPPVQVVPGALRSIIVLDKLEQYFRAAEFCTFENFTLYGDILLHPPLDAPSLLVDWSLSISMSIHDWCLCSEAEEVKRVMYDTMSDSGIRVELQCMTVVGNDSHHRRLCAYIPWQILKTLWEKVPAGLLSQHLSAPFLKYFRPALFHCSSSPNFEDYVASLE